MLASLKRRSKKCVCLAFGVGHGSLYNDDPIVDVVRDGVQAQQPAIVHVRLATHRLRESVNRQGGNRRGADVRAEIEEHASDRVLAPAEVVEQADYPLKQAHLTAPLLDEQRPADGSVARAHEVEAVVVRDREEGSELPGRVEEFLPSNRPWLVAGASARAHVHPRELICRASVHSPGALRQEAYRSSSSVLYTRKGTTGQIRSTMETSRPSPSTAEALIAAARIDAVVTHHSDGFRSGVARFNELLADRLGVPVVPVFDPQLVELACPLLSFKVSELSLSEAAELARIFAERDRQTEVFLHEFSGLELERQVIRAARRVHCGNLEIHEQVTDLNDAVTVAWTPGLIVDERRFEPAEISVFSFGMAHKIRTDMFRRLRALLEQSGRSYALYVSTANHETASMRDAQVVFEEMGEVFPSRLYFMGNLSDVAVYNHLQTTTFFAAFFGDGVRANNTSVSSAMEQGAIVVTNLDRHSPREFVHMENVIDINQCRELPFDPVVLKRLSLNAMETGRRRGWDDLVAQLRA
jgi:hypothetical protein